MIDKLEMFIVLAQEGHFGRASEIIGITQPSLSSAIRQLEDILGVTLVRRGTRYQGLTPEGERLLVWAQRIVGDTKIMRAEFNDIRQGTVGRLKLGVIPTATVHATNLTVPLLERHPSLQLNVVTTSVDDIIAQVDAMKYDAGVIYQTDLPAKFDQHPIYSERLMLVVHKDHDLARKDAVVWEDLIHEPLCLLTSNMRNRMIVWKKLSLAGRTIQPRLEVDNLLSLLYHVKTSMVVSVIPEGLSGLVADLSDLRYMPLPGDTDQVSLVMLSRLPRMPILHELVQSARRLSDVLAGRDTATPHESR